jgi:hypothetical protein
MIPQRQIAIDFDGVLQFQDHPYLSRPVPHAIETVKRLSEVGHVLILLTMRVDEELDQAIAWCKDHDLHFDYVNCNPMMETGSRKVYAHWVIDDHNLGIPLIHDLQIHRKPFVDWRMVSDILEQKGLIRPLNQ